LVPIACQYKMKIMQDKRACCITSNRTSKHT
jgi:hypothetical protein